MAIEGQFGLIAHPGVQLLVGNRDKLRGEPRGSFAVFDESRENPRLHALVFALSRVLVGEQRGVDVNLLQLGLEVIAELQGREELPKENPLVLFG